MGTGRVRSDGCRGCGSMNCSKSCRCASTPCAALGAGCTPCWRPSCPWGGNSPRPGAPAHRGDRGEPGGRRVRGAWRDRAGQRLSQFLPVGISETVRTQIGDLPSGHGLLGELIRSPEPLRLTELSQHPASSGFPGHHRPMYSFLGVPVRVRDEPPG